MRGLEVGIHDTYGKEVLRSASGGNVVTDGPPVEIEYGAEAPCRIDGVVAASIAVEIESRTGKQVRGAVLDLQHHRLPKKLLVLIPMYMHNAHVECRRCSAILGRSSHEADYRVVVLAGTGEAPRFREDVAKVEAALFALGMQQAPVVTTDRRPEAQAPAILEINGRAA
jgi:hypothetical protein